ncbi:MAG: ABC transporter permease [Promicromonosporaceae bacterium]|nr:ABC transporter permease [Promicromonosporaceae bacterium]
MRVSRQERDSALAMEPLRPAGPAEGFVGSTLHAIKDVFDHRELLGLLTRREIKARYKDSALGLIWSLIRPIVQLLVYWVALGQFMGMMRAIPEFAVFIFTGLTIWQLFTDIVTQGTNTIVANAGLIKKVYVPREIFPLSTIGSALFNFGMQMVVLILFLGLRSAQLSARHGEGVNLFPLGSRWIYGVLALLLTLLWAGALALLLSAINVYLRDTQWLVEISMMVLFWASPTVYALRMVTDQVGGWLLQVYLANPMTMAVLGFQRAFWVPGDGFDTPGTVCREVTTYDAGGLVEAAQVCEPGRVVFGPTAYPGNMMLRLGIMIAICTVLLWGAHRVFARLQANFAQEL